MDLVSSFRSMLRLRLPISCRLEKQGVPKTVCEETDTLLFFPVLASVQSHSYFPDGENC